MKTKKTPTRRNETTSARVASVAARALKGPTKREAFMAYFEFREKTPAILKTSVAFEAGARWWHRRVKSALASALTQAPDTKRRKR